VNLNAAQVVANKHPLVHIHFLHDNMTTYRKGIILLQKA